MFKRSLIPQFGVWVPYHGFHYKEPYDVMLSTGEIIESMYPNGNKWSKGGEYISPIEVDYETIVAVRLLTDEDIRSRGIRHYTGSIRLDRMNCNTMSKEKFYYVFTQSEMIDDNKLRTFINEIRDTAIQRINSDSLRESLSKVVKKLVDGFRV